MPTDVDSYSSSSYFPSGTYAISSADDLVNLATIVNNSGLSTSNTYEFELTSDVDLADSGFTSIGVWGPTASTHVPFIGTFDGKGYSIKNLSISGTYTTTDRAIGGLFADVSGATLKNIILEDVSTTTSQYAGAICGYADENTVITDCHIKSGTISTSSNYVGGIVGYNFGVIENCSNAATITSSGSNTNGYGGIVGSSRSKGFIINCSNSSDISGTAQVGGILGSNAGLITNSVNSGTLTLTSSSSTSDNAGGIVGNNTGYIVNCVSVGTITPSSSQSGGIGAVCYQSSSSSGTAYNSYGLGFTNVTNIVETGTYSSNVAGTSYGSQILDSSSGWSGSATISIYTMTVSRTSSAVTVSGSESGTTSSSTSVTDVLNAFVNSNPSFSDGTNSWTLKTWATDSSGNPALQD